MEHIYLTCIHDRHTDDVYLAFTNEADAKAYLRTMQERNRWKDAEENNQYGDWCLYVTDDYYMFVQKVDVQR